MMDAADDWALRAEENIERHEQNVALNPSRNGHPTTLPQMNGHNVEDSDNEEQSFCVRVPDDDDIFEGDNVYENSPYLDQAKRNFEKEKNALTEEQRKQARNLFSFILLLCIAAMSYFVYGDTLLPGRKNDIYYFQTGFGASLPPDLSDAYMEWDAVLDSRFVLPVFWNIPLSGGDVLEEVVASCLGLVQANEVGNLVKEGYSQTLEIVDVFGDSYVNVDTTTPEGIIHASSMKLAQSGLADVIFTPMVYEPTQLFLPPETGYHGYMFTIIRHPIERAVHMFYYLQEATWDPLYTREISGMTIEQYAHSSYAENNWLTRILSNHVGGAITDHHIQLAKETLRRKFLVGLFSNMKFSVKRFEKRFSWYIGDEESAKCEESVMEKELEKYKKVPMLEEGSLTWKLLERRNKFDMEIYEFAQTLFLNQKSKDYQDYEIYKGEGDV